jgi:hypothetical protein
MVVRFVSLVTVHRIGGWYQQLAEVRCGDQLHFHGYSINRVATCQCEVVNNPNEGLIFLGGKQCELGGVRNHAVNLSFAGVRANPRRVVFFFKF